MPVKIRLMRIGAKKRPFYRVVAVDERAKRTGGYLELLGTYNPLTNPKEIILKQDKIDEWIKKGAVMSDGFLRIIGKAPQRPARKPKKEKKEEPAAPAPAEPVDQIKSEETSESGEPVVTESTETPVEEVSALEPSEPTEATDNTETPISSDLSETPVEEEAK
jgi:small subunit ribosomal protein S16